VTGRDRDQEGAVDATVTGTVDATVDEGRWRELFARLEDEVGDMSLETAEEILATIPGYDGAARENIVSTAHQNLSMSTRVIARGSEPTAEDVRHAGQTALERIGEGVPLGSLLSGFRLSMRRIQRRLLTLAPEYGIPADRLLDWSTLLWTLGDVFSTCVTAVYRDHEIARTVADSTRRAEWVSRLVTGDLAEAEILRGAALYRIPTGTPVRLLVAPSTPSAPDAGPGADTTLHRWAEGAGARLLTTVQARTVTGILVGDVDAASLPSDMTVALGRPAVLTDLHRTFVAVDRLLRAAVELGLSGIVDEETLSWRMAVTASPETTDLLVRRYLDPLREARAFGDELVDSVRAYLDNRLNVRAAAACIPVHVNTLRYRLHRFEELTGCDLGEVDTLVEVAWVMAATGAGRPD
jgi:putative transposase